LKGVRTQIGQKIPKDLQIGKKLGTIDGIAVCERMSFEAMKRAIAVNRINPVLDRVFDWRDAASAFRKMESVWHFGKIVLKF
jgi:NADPH:quinone reductase-like Zn-dependent oxidoreductase